MKPIEAVVARAIWDVDLGAMPAWRARLTRVARIAHALVTDLTEGQLNLRAMSLVYTTLLSLVPLLAVSFSVLKGFGVHNQIEPLLLNVLAPLGEKGAELTGSIIGFVENMQVGVLGSLGLALLLYTVISLIQKIERAFNYVWHTTSTRSVGQRFSSYLSVIMVGPVLMFTAMGLTASLMSTGAMQWLSTIEPFATALNLMGPFLPYGLVIGAFAFVYVCVPNTRVRPVPARLGAAVAGFLWETTGFLFASFISTSTRYTAIYSGFAILIVFMIWIYLSWLILLLGAGIAFYVQHPEHVAPRRQESTLSNRLKEKLALLLMARIGRDYFDGRDALTMERLAAWLGVPMDVVAAVLESLEAGELVVRTAHEPPGYVPARAPDTVRVAAILEAVRSAEETPFLSGERLPRDPGVDAVLERLERAVAEALDNETLKELGCRS